MPDMLIKPMGIGLLIDRSFQLYRKHFAKLMLLMLILLGPIYLFQSFLLSDAQSVGSESVLEQIQQGVSVEEILITVGENSNTMDIWKILLLVLVVMPILLIIIGPIAVATVVYMVKAFLSGEPIPSVSELLRSAFRRLGPLAGSTFLVALIMFGIYMVTVIVIILLVLVVALLAGVVQGFEGSSPGVGMIILMVLGGILLFFSCMLGISYFFIRFMYYLPFVALAEESIAIGRSWRITRKSFWRLFLMYLVIAIVLYIIVTVTSLVFAFLTVGIVSQLLQSIVSIVLMPLWFIPYVLSFFDLRARNEGMGLDELIQNTIQEDGAITTHE